VFVAFGAFVYRRRVLVLIVAGLFLAVSIGLLVRGGPLTSGSIDGLEATRAQDLVDRVLGEPYDTTFVALFRPRSESPEALASFDADVDDAVATLKKDPAVRSVTSPGNAPNLVAPHLRNDDAHTQLAIIVLNGDIKDGFAAYPRIHDELGAARVKAMFTGKIPFNHDLAKTMESDLLHAEIISLPIALIVLLLVFRTVVASVLPIGVGGLAVMGGIGMILGLSHVMDIAQYTLNVTSLIGLGVAIDYSLFTVSRYREELANGHDYPEALALAMDGAGRVVAFSGFAVATGLSGLFFFRGSYLFAMGLGGAIVVFLSVVFALTFLPALLAVLGPRIHAGKLPIMNVGPKEGVWHRMAHAVMERPVAVLVPTLAVLLIMGVPFLHLRLLSIDVRVLDTTVEARQAYELMKKDFPDAAATRMEVAIHFPTPGIDAARVKAILDLTQSFKTIPGVTSVQSLAQPDPRMTLDPKDMPKPEELAELFNHPTPDVAPFLEQARALFFKDGDMIMHVLTDAKSESDEARTIVKTIRAHRQVADGTLEVGGQTAQDVDATAFILGRAPWAVGTVVAVTLVVLFLLLRSLVLPIKAILMNLVSIAGSFGALVYLYQDGHFWVKEPRPLEPALPILLFCVLFGLSMDYEVLMLSRMKEAYGKTGDNTAAVAEGLEKSAGLITSAAAIMVAVFAAFALAHVILIQAVGFGMAIAVALDATLVRVLLVPATMRLFGDANWWAPAFMGGHPPPTHPPEQPPKTP
jgi:RND superfamily putative drug exporter